MSPRALAVRTIALALAALALAAPRPAAAGAFSDMRGQISVGYAKLFISDAPSGSISTSAGLNLPLAGDWRWGAGLGLHLLGSRTVERGSLLANVDYSLFEAGVYAHWSPSMLGPVGLISFGPEVMSARAELSTAGGGAAFSDLAVEKIAPGGMLSVTFISRHRAPVLLGLELGVHYAVLPDDDWTIASARVVLHY